MTEHYAQYSKILLQQAKLNQQKEVVGVFSTNKIYVPHWNTYSITEQLHQQCYLLHVSVIVTASQNPLKFFLHLHEVDWSFSGKYLCKNVEHQAWGLSIKNTQLRKYNWCPRKICLTAGLSQGMDNFKILHCMSGWGQVLKNQQ